MRGKIKYIACILIGVVFAALAATRVMEAKAEALQQEIAKEVFRFHVLANSDGEADQNLKMQVKKAILSYMQSMLSPAESVEETKNWAESHLAQLEMVAAEVVKANGFSYEVRAEVTECYFPEKSYGDVTFPAGKYEALRIEIGEAKGQNWWCVLYPNLCFRDAIHAVVPDEGKEELKQVLEDDAYELITTKTRFRLKWFFF